MQDKSPFTPPGSMDAWGLRIVFKCSATAALLVILSFLWWSYDHQGIVFTLLRADTSAAEKIARLREFFLSFGRAAPLAYVLLVTIEVVVAPIPGAMLYAPGGVVFGGFWGGLLALIGNVLGAGISCALVRVGRPLAQRWLQRHALSRYEARLSNRGIWVVLLLRVNPLTSSDLVSYAAGLTSMPIRHVMLGTLLGMAPLCWAQAYLAEELFEAMPGLIYPLLIVCLVYVLGVAWIIRRMATRPRPESPSGESRA